VVEITKKKRKDKEFTITWRSSITENRNSRTNRMENCNSIFSSLIAFRHTLWKARHARQR
jgi:hypothetical protein